MTLAMTDEQFLRAFESAALPAGAFHHADHVRLAWLYLDRYPALEAIARFGDGLRRFAAAQGKATLYHETVTWAFLLLIRERQARAPAAGWAEFAAGNPDLLAWRPSALARYYRDETLASDLARRVFVLPDRVDGGAAPPPRP
jgi:hypothetical protein